MSGIFGRWAGLHRSAAYIAHHAGVCTLSHRLRGVRPPQWTMPRRQSSRAAWPALCAAAGGGIAFGALLHLLEPTAAAAALEPFLLSGPQAPRCPSCGWIEAKRELAPLAGDPHALRTYEYTLRMRDGSMRVFQETLPTSWRLGERLMLIENIERPE